MNIPLAAPGPVALHALADAEANVGVHEEGGNNTGKYVETYLASVGLHAGDPWCAAFVYFRLQQAAKAQGKELSRLLLKPPKSGYCPDWKNWAQANGLWTPLLTARMYAEAIQPGDLCLFYFAAKERVAHIGLVAGVEEWGCWTVEGNTSPEAQDAGSGINRDGDGVYRKRRNWAEFGKGRRVRPAAVLNLAGGICPNTFMLSVYVKRAASFFGPGDPAPT